MSKSFALNEKQRPISVPVKYWWFYPGGRLKSIKLPPYAFGTYPMRQGYMMTPFSKFLDQKSRYGWHYYENSELRPLFLGKSLDAAVSPDGCKFAFTHRPIDAKKIETTLKMIDVCKHRDAILAIEPVPPPKSK